VPIKTLFVDGIISSEKDERGGEIMAKNERLKEGKRKR